MEWIISALNLEDLSRLWLQLSLSSASAVSRAPTMYFQLSHSRFCKLPDSLSAPRRGRFYELHLALHGEAVDRFPT